jgi:hypothetical protein
MIKSSGNKALLVPATNNHQESIIATIAAYIDKKKTKDDALRGLITIEKQITKSG